MSPLRILIADDEPLNALALQSQLEALGHQVVGAAVNGREAAELAARMPTDLAILDIRMPEVSGVQAAREIFRMKPMPIILLTGFNDPAYIDQAVAAPVFHYLLKPVTLEDLSPAISVARNRFQEWRTFRGEAATLLRRLEDRKVIEQAKGVLMSARGVSDAEAREMLRRESEARSEPVAEIARMILLANHLLEDSPAV